MYEDDTEYISVEELKTKLTDLSPKDIVSYAYKEWIPCQRTGYTIVNLETGNVKGLGIENNQLPFHEITYIELFTIEAQENPIKPEDFFSKEEYEKYLEFKGDDPSEYTPDIVSNFCIKEGINEEDRNITILADRFEEDEYWNYNKWESGVLNEYYNVINNIEEWESDE
ncbi:hypothetical protein LJC03_02300 [Methanobrevibacter sp. OttesenSCG-928-I08]|nr:hypothetical protein [Methanobrevibacter sp. OttesenSCG-928-I08]